jgi:ubiquinone/menaquinone biosynthesis C-methylase UbiE
MTVLHDEDLSAAFDRAARRYDALKAANPGCHRELRRSARRLALPHEGAGLRVLDLGRGTGASAAALATTAPRAGIVAVDASAGMLRRAAGKPWPGRVTFLRATAEALPQAVARGPFDAVFAAYLFRNVTDPDRVLATTYGLLAPGGRLAVHEYALSGRAVHRAVWTAVGRGIVQPAGPALGDGALYSHLWRSVLRFDTAPAFTERVRQAGFTQVAALPVAGWQTGVVHTFVARRPATATAATGARDLA